MIGTGASAVQFIPEIAPTSASCSCSSARRRGSARPPTTTTRSSPGLRWLYGHVPVVQRVEPVLDLLAHGRRRARRRARSTPTGNRRSAVGQRGQRPRCAWCSTGYLDDRVRRPARPARAGACPSYPPGAKRMLRDNGVWARALKRDNVAADHRRRSARSRRHGIVTADGVEHEVDVIIYGTGFQASKFLTPMTRARAAAASTCTSSGPATPAPTSASRSPASRTCSASTGRTRTSSSTAASSTSPSAGCATSSAASSRLLAGGHARSRCARTCTTSSTSRSTRRTADGVGLLRR